MSKTEHERLSEKAMAKTRAARTYDEHHDAAEAHQQAAQAKGRAGYGVEAAKHSSEAGYHRTKAAQKPPLSSGRHISAGPRTQPAERTPEAPKADEHAARREHTAAKPVSAAGSDAQRLDHAVAVKASSLGAVLDENRRKLHEALRQQNKPAPMKTSKVHLSKLRPVPKVQEMGGETQASKTKAAVAVKQRAALKAQPAGRSRAGGPALYFKEGYGTKYPTGALQKGKKGGTFLLINGNKYYVGKK